MKKKKPKIQQKREPPRTKYNIRFPKQLAWGIEAIAEMENWTISKTVVEIVSEVLLGTEYGKSNVSRKARS